MYKFRMSKYNNDYRDINGVYHKDEWTSVYDIGKIFEGHELTYDEYIEVEKRYIKATTLFLQRLGVQLIRVVELEKYNIKNNDLYKSAHYTQAEYKWF